MKWQGVEAGLKKEKGRIGRISKRQGWGSRGEGRSEEGEGKERQDLKKAGLGEEVVEDGVGEEGRVASRADLHSPGHKLL